MSSPVQLGFDVSSSADAGSWQGPAKMTVRRSMLTALLMSSQPEYEFDDSELSDSESSDCEGDCEGHCGSGDAPCSPTSQPIDIPRSP
jgi:hypothetical protein